MAPWHRISSVTGSCEVCVEKSSSTRAVRWIRTAVSALGGGLEVDSVHPEEKVEKGHHEFTIEL